MVQGVSEIGKQETQRPDVLIHYSRSEINQILRTTIERIEVLRKLLDISISFNSQRAIDAF